MCYALLHQQCWNKIFLACTAFSTHSLVCRAVPLRNFTWNHSPNLFAWASMPTAEGIKNWKLRWFLISTPLKWNTDLGTHGLWTISTVLKGGVWLNLAVYRSSVMYNVTRGQCKCRWVASIELILFAQTLHVVVLAKLRSTRGDVQQSFDKVV